MKALEITEAEYVAAVNEWWRMYIDAPEEYQSTVASVKEVLHAEAAGREPTIGQRDLEFLKLIVTKLRKRAPKPASTPRKKGAAG